MQSTLVLNGLNTTRELLSRVTCGVQFPLFYIPGIFISITIKFQNLLTVGQYRLETFRGSMKLLTHGNYKPCFVGQWISSLYWPTETLKLYRDTNKNFGNIEQCNINSVITSDQWKLNATSDLQEMIEIPEWRSHFDWSLVMTELMLH